MFSLLMFSLFFFWLNLEDIGLIKNLSSKYKNKVNKNIVEGSYEETKQDDNDEKLIKWVIKLYQNL